MALTCVKPCRRHFHLKRYFPPEVQQSLSRSRRTLDDSCPQATLSVTVKLEWRLRARTLGRSIFGVERSFKQP